MSTESVTGDNTVHSFNEASEVKNGTECNMDIVWRPDCESSKIPFVGQKFQDIDEAFNFYKDYGRVCGFDVRRSSHKKNTDGGISFKYFLCSKAGFRTGYLKEQKSEKISSSQGSTSILSQQENSDYVLKHSRRRTSRKCGCTAMICLKFMGADGFIVNSFNEHHNHYPADEDSRQFLRCNRRLTDIHKKFILDASKNCFGASRAHSIFKSMSGTYADVGATKVDFKNFSRDVKKYIGVHDADMIIQKFKDRSEITDKEFKYEFEVDSENRLTRLFWADAKGRSLYTVYGDCVSFDATYRTNKYKMIFIPFVGIDNHWKSVTFASALISQEDVESFEWVCIAFKKVMGKQPKCVITDQCPAMNIAIPKSLPLSKHRYCMWHIMKKFPSKLGTIFCLETPFMDKISNFVWMDHASPEEFEAGWREVLTEFGLQDHNWLNELFDLREKWIPAYFNNEPMVGLLRTTSRSESSNFYFSHFVERGDTLSEFYLCYESAIEKQRHESSRINHDDSAMPVFLTQKKIEREASHLYTLTMFYKVQSEIRGSCFEIQLQSMSELDAIKTFIVKDELVESKTFQVEVRLQTNDVHCSCHLYTRVGLLCKHSFFALAMCGIESIPRQFLTDRWMKNAEKRFSTLKLDEVSDGTSKEVTIRSKKTESWFDFQTCINDAGDDGILVDIVYDSVKEMKKKLYQAKTKSSARLNDDVIEQLVGIKPAKEVTVLPPKQINNKGSRKRIPNPAEKSIGGIKRQKRLCKKCNVRGFHDSRNCGKGSNTEETTNQQQGNVAATENVSSV